MNGRVDTAMVTTANDLPGYRIVRNYGIVRGIVVRSRSIVGNFAAALQTVVVGGNITILTNLCEKTREDAFELMHATCGPAWRKRRRRHALRRHRSDAGRNRSPGLRHRRAGRALRLTQFLTFRDPSRRSLPG